MLVVDSLRRSFGTAVAVDGVSFTIPTGGVFGLLGPNGAGKTTTMRSILGIYVPDSGTITWRGRAIDRVVRRRFGYLPEERGLYGKMSVREQVEYFGRLRGIDSAGARARTKRWLATLDLERYATKPCGQLSKGNQQKVQLASAVIADPELLVLDEPFSGLDPMNADTMLACIAALAEGGTTIVLSSHQMFQIEAACGAFCIVGNGKVRAAGTLAELRADFPTRTVRVTPDEPAIRAVFARAGAPEPARSSDGELTYELPATTDFGALLRASVAAGAVESFERHAPSLNAIYVRALEATA